MNLLEFYGKNFSVNVFSSSYFVQTITGAMSTLNPPITLEKPDNQARVDYIQDYASGKYSWDTTTEI